MQYKPMRMLRAKAVAHLLDVHVSSIYRAIEAGELRAVRVGPSHGAVRIPQDSLDAYLQRFGVDPHALAGEGASAQ